MKIGLIDVDGHNFPNLALMKLSAWHRKNGDDVSFWDPIVRYDTIYASKIFTFTPDVKFSPMASEFKKGGTGYFYPSGGDPLPDCVEHIMPDYALYGVQDTAYGFLSRGCPRGCDFCIVSKKEGMISRKVSDLKEWWDGQRNIKLLDPNLTACKDWEDLMGQLAESHAIVDFTQGLDIRLMNERKCEALNKIRTKMLHFAWDGKDDLEHLFRRYGPLIRQSKSHRSVYVLTNYNTDMAWNLHRIYTLRDCGFLPYVMVYDKEHAPHEIRQLQRWANNYVLFSKFRTFEDYKNERNGRI